MYTQAQIDAYVAHLHSMGTYKPADVVRYRDHLEANYGPKAPGGSPETALPQDTMDWKQRIAQSFGDGGNPAVKGQDGKWARDPQNFFPTDYEHPIQTAHPLNYLESSVGQVPVMAGMVGGAIAGDGLASIPGAAYGAAAGESVRQQIGKRLGTYGGTPDEQMSQAIDQGANGAMAEMGGQVINKIPLPTKMLPQVFTDRTVGDALQTGSDYALKKARNLIANSTYGLTLGKTHPEAAARMISRPREVMGMTETNHVGNPSGVAQDVANQAEREIQNNLKSKGRMVGDSNARFEELHGREMADTRGIMAQSNDFLQNIPLNEMGEGQLDQGQIAALSDWADKHLTTTERTPGPDRKALYSKPVYGEPGTLSVTDRRGDFPADLVRSTNFGKDRPPLLGYDSTYLKRPYGDLKPTSDALRSDVVNEMNKNPLSTHTPLDLQYKENMADAIKRRMHVRDPDFLGADDKAYAQLKTDAKTLRGLNTETNGEGLVSNAMNRNKSGVRSAMQRAIPETYNGPLQDLAANRDFNQGGVVQGKWPTITQGARGVGMAAAASAYGGMHDPFTAGLAAAAVGAATDPGFHKYMLHYGSRMSEPVTDLIRRHAGQISPMYLKGKSPWDLQGDR